MLYKDLRGAANIRTIVVVLLFYVHDKQLRSCRHSQLT